MLKGLASAIARRAVEGGMLPASLTGYRFNRSVSLDDACANSGGSVRELLSPHGFATTTRVPMPYPVASSFEGSRSYTATIHQCYVARCADKWGNEHFALFDRAGRNIREPGLGCRPEHARIFAELASTAPRLGSWCWAMRRWPKNHCHWLLEDLPAFAMACELGMSKDVVVPGRKGRTPFNSFCIDSLSLSENQSTDLADPIVFLESLTLVRVSRYHPTGIELARKTLGGGGAPGVRKIYICREKAWYRKVVNEDEVWAGLAARGFERIFMEDLRPAEQVQAMASAAIVVGLHGAGMANVVLCPAGSHVVEVLDRRWHAANQDIFRKCCAVGSLHYWPISGDTSESSAAAGYRDIRIDTEELFGVLDSIG